MAARLGQRHPDDVGGGVGDRDGVVDSQGLSRDGCYVSYQYHTER